MLFNFKRNKRLKNLHFVGIIKVYFDSKPTAYKSLFDVYLNLFIEQHYL